LVSPSTRDCLPPLTVGGGRSLVPQVLAGPAAEEAQIGKEAVFSEVFGVSMVRTERYKMSVDARARQPVDLYDMSEDPNELRNRVDDPALARVRQELLEEYLSRLLSSIDETKLSARAEDLGRMFGVRPA
jgi:arylsulfatase A-like enzyme